MKQLVTDVHSFLTSQGRSISDLSDPAQLWAWAWDLQLFLQFLRDHPDKWTKGGWIPAFGALTNRINEREIFTGNGLILKTMEDYMSDLHGLAAESTARLAIALNDSPQDRRVAALATIADEDPTLFVRVIDDITSLSRQRNDTDPYRFFDCVATVDFLRELPKEAKYCHWCHEAFKTGFTMHWRFCNRHAICNTCAATQGLQALRCYRCMPCPTRHP